MNRALWLFLPLLAFVLIGCPPPIDTGADGGATGPFTVTPTGGPREFIRDGVYFNIPEGAVESDTTITVTVIDTGVPEVPNRKRVSYGFRISPQTLVFKTPITIGLGWLQDRIPPGVQPDSFDMRRSSATDAYLELPNPALVNVPLLDIQGITARTERLGVFWLTSPAQAAVSEIKLDPPDAFLEVGGEQQFTAEVLDPGGNKIEGAKVTWSVVAPRVASVDENGLLKALGPGIATLTASSSDVSVSATVRVRGNAKGPLTFVHDNPFPTGNDLFGGAISNGHAFFAGGNGTVLWRSPTDQWTRLYSAPIAQFKAVAGNFPTSAVAVGVSINTGILVEVNSGTSTLPALKTFSTSQPRAVWFDGTHGMAVGDGNDVLIRRNGAWVTEYSPSFESLMSVVGDGAGGFVTVGNLGSIYQYDPATKVWNSLYQTSLSVQLKAGAIVNSAGTEAWAVGGNKLWHFVTDNWTALNLPASPVINEMTALAVIDSRIVVSGTTLGGDSHVLIYEPTGATWTSQQVRSPQVIRGLFGSGTAGYAVGTYGAVWEYSSTGKNFVERSRGFIGHVADIATNGTDVLAAMNVCANAACTSVSPTVLQRGSANWTALGNAPFGGALTALAMRSPTEVYAATPNALYVYDGVSWSNVSAVGTPSGSAPSFFDVAICGTNLWTVGQGGVSYKGASNGAIRQVGYTASGTTEDLYGVFCPTPTETWTAGIGVLLQNRQLRSTTGTNHGPYLNVWSPGVGEAFAFGDARFGAYWDTTTVRVIDAEKGQLGGILPDVITSQWGSTADNHYLVGYVTNPVRYSFALRGNGAEFQFIDPGADRIPTVVTGSSNTDIWIGTQGGGILRGVPPP